MVQWTGVRLPMQRTQVQFPVGEALPCWGAAKPMCHNDCAHVLKPTGCNYWAQEAQPLRPACLEPVLRNEGGNCRVTPLSTTAEKPAHSSEDPAWPEKFKKKEIIFFKRTKTSIPNILEEKWQLHLSPPCSIIPPLPGWELSKEAVGIKQKI